MDVRIIYEDNHLLVTEKPVNIPVQEDSSRDCDLLSILRNDIKIRYNKPGNVFLALVHRLDRPVGGVMVFAKTSKAASRLSDSFRKQEIERSYLAVVRGCPPEKYGLLEHYLLKNRRKNIVHVVPEDTKHAKKAVLEYEVLDETDDLGLLSVKLHTGRSHQIRVQLSTSGYPIYGDQKYGRHVNKPGEQIALWSHKLTLLHPVKKEPMTFISLPPEKYPWTLWTDFLRKNNQPVM